ncbi:hypothetical protein [Polaromonas sp. CG_9.11]|uniref:hypothetical protein n=1 Tax=Polaromonas sp. CG_9.11 TaxID=2787730 RepID=UPI0018CA59D1|nr:hypothetical protein [Polaromonas sp. CG_9.11]MBG6075259.1 hypothetical protein [Polaromonas sp. CG_9.11]
MTALSIMLSRQGPAARWTRMIGEGEKSDERSSNLRRPGRGQGKKGFVVLEEGNVG